jgi:copper(I)-binding protein
VKDLRAKIMLTKAARPGRTTGSRPIGPAIATRAGAAALLAALGAALAGCAGQAEASAPQIELVTAYVGVPHDGNPTDAYVAIRNNGNADQLVSVHTSVGGTVTLRGPAGASPDIERDFSSIPIPGHTLVRLNPTSYHLVISGARPMKAGTEITLTLVFAHDGSYQIPAEVTNPQTGGASYFLN